VKCPAWTKYNTSRMTVAISSLLDYNQYFKVTHIKYQLDDSVPDNLLVTVLWPTVFPAARDIDSDGEHLASGQSHLG
jgi:hypothetical protein